MKLALKHNIPLVPVYVFGSNDLFSTTTFFYQLRWKLMKNFGICVPFAKGTWGSFLPKAVKNTIVVGDPIKLEKVNDVANITSEELDAAHALYAEKLRELFEANKDKLGYGDRELKIV